MEILNQLIRILFLIIQFWLMTYFIFVIIGVIIDLFKIKTTPKINFQQSQLRNYNFAVIITLHQDTKFLNPILDALLKQNYSEFGIFVVADDCAPINSLLVKHEKVNIIYTLHPLHSKIKSIQFAMEQIPSTYDAIAIFDPDNLVHPDFMRVMNAYFNAGYKAVQSNILPKNFDTSIAKLDAMCDEYYNFIDRYIPSEINLCAHISGRGTVVDINIYKSIVYTKFLGGFDKKLQLELSKKTITTYASKAILFDEKISDAKSLQHQRTRWINTYFNYFKESFHLFLHAIKQRNFRQLFFAFNNMRPPLFIQILLMIFFIIIDLFFNQTLLLIWLIVLITYSLSFLYISSKLYKLSTCLKSAMLIPVFFIRQIRALFNIKKANKKFLQTLNQQVVFIDDILKQ